MTTEYSISHVLFHRTADGGQPRTPVVIIYLQDKLVSLNVEFRLESAPTIVWVAHSWGLPVPRQNVSIHLSSLWHFTGFIAYQN